MGYAIRRANGTYRGWCRNAPAGELEPGESWEEREDKPTITVEIAPDPLVVALHGATTVEDLKRALLDHYERPRGRR